LLTHTLVKKLMFPVYRQTIMTTIRADSSNVYVIGILHRTIPIEAFINMIMTLPEIIEGIAIGERGALDLSAFSILFQETVPTIVARVAETIPAEETTKHIDTMNKLSPDNIISTLNAITTKEDDSLIYMNILNAAREAFAEDPSFIETIDDVEDACIVQSIDRS